MESMLIPCFKKDGVVSAAFIEANSAIDKISSHYILKNWFWDTFPILENIEKQMTKSNSSITDEEKWFIDLRFRLALFRDSVESFRLYLRLFSYFIEKKESLIDYLNKPFNTNCSIYFATSILKENHIFRIVTLRDQMLLIFNILYELNFPERSANKKNIFNKGRKIKLINDFEAYSSCLKTIESQRQRLIHRNEKSTDLSTQKISFLLHELRTQPKSGYVDYLYKSSSEKYIELNKPVYLEILRNISRFLNPLEEFLDEIGIEAKNKTAQKGLTQEKA